VSGDVAVDGDVNADSLHIDGSKPFIFTRYTGLENGADIDTEVAADEYVCGVVGFEVLNGDIDEATTGAIIRAWAYKKDNTWHFKASFRTHSSTPKLYVDIMCVDLDVADSSGYW
jgi:hypothetical protein